MRWFCADGAVLPPRAFACADHGGGIQHGQLSDEAQTLRDGGYAVANVLAATDPTDFTGEHPDLGLLTQILLERFLVDWDDGWIFQRARRIPGMLQAEDEEEAARRLVRTLLNDPHWRTPERFLLLREVARLLPVAGDVRQAARVRERALRLAERDASFVPLRAKLHSLPDPGDAERVRAHARARAASGLTAEYEALARAVEELYAPVSVVAPLEALAARIARPPLPRPGPRPGTRIARPVPGTTRRSRRRSRRSTVSRSSGSARVRSRPRMVPRHT